MSKEKMREIVIDNQKKLVIVAMIIMAIILLITSMAVFADDNSDYVVEVKDYGEKNLVQDGHASLTKKIVGETSKSLTYELNVSNMKDKSQVPEIAVVMDNSRSMNINDTNKEVKGKVKSLITELLNNSSTAKVSLSDNTGIKQVMGRAEVSTYTTAVDNISYNNGESVVDGVTRAISSFSGSTTAKYLVVFTDATDTIKDKLQEAVSNGIQVYSVLTDMTNDEYEAATDKSLGDIKMIADIENFSYIYDNVNLSMINVKVQEVFTEETKKYFDLTIDSKPAGVTATDTTDGYTFECRDIKAGETKTIKYTLTLKNSVAIDAGKIYRELKSNQNIKITYDAYKDYETEAKTVETDESPTYVICRKYSMTIQAVSEKSDKIPVTGLDVKVIGTVVTGTDSDGKDITKEVYNQTLTTDSNGKILIDELKTLGDITFEISPDVNQFGYSDTSATQIIVHNDPTGVGAIWAESDVTEPIVDNVKRNVTVKLPISVDTYTLEVETVDANNSNVKIGNVEYRLIQPKLNSKYDMEALYATTDSDGKLIFKPAVMTKDGTYQYVLTQMTEQEGYDSMGNVSLFVTFENGKVLSNFTHKFNDQVESEWINDSSVKVIAKNAAQEDEMFNLQINLMDKINNDIKIEGAVYDIDVARVTSAGEEVETSFKNNMTDSNGQINLEIPGTGYVRVRIKEVATKPGYVEDTVTKEIVVYRTKGTVQYVSATTPNGIRANADSGTNTLIVNLETQEGTEQNRIRVKLIDEEERDVNIIGVTVQLTKVGSTETYTARTDRDGYATFIIANEPLGEAQYSIDILEAPAGYVVGNLNLATIKASFNSKKFIYAGNTVSYTTPYAKTTYEQLTEDASIFDTLTTEVSLTPDVANTYYFKINVVDAITGANPLAGAKYSVVMESENGIKELIGRLTNADGQISTRMLTGEDVTITIRETATPTGYKINKEEQVIKLHYDAVTGYTIVSQNPYEYDVANGQYIGTEISGKDIVYHDVNEKKSGADTILNLYINKKDTNNYLVAGVRNIISSSTLKMSDGTSLDSNRSTVDASGNPVTINYWETDNNGYFEILGIRVKGNELKNGERVDYLQLHEVDKDGKAIPNTEITIKLTFRYNTYKNIVAVTNVEATWGNRLVIKKEFSGYESDIAYESNVYLDLYTDYDDVGNFALDLQKVNKQGDLLPGAKYDVVVTRPDGSRLTRKGIDVTDRVELEGFMVSAGTTIEVTESAAPIGYEKNEYTEILTVKSIDAITGEMELVLEESNYSTPRASVKTNTRTMSDGTLKTEAILTLTDLEIDTFKFGIEVKDSVTQDPVSEYKFRVTSDHGPQKDLNPTNAEGKANALVGANYHASDYGVTGYEVEYTIDNLVAANYYKKLAQPIVVKVVFDMDGYIDATATYNANASLDGYGTIWSINAVNTADGNDIDIRINVDPQDKLIVNVQTQDVTNSSSLTNVEYAITPTHNIPGTGTTKIEVGYVLPNGIETYVIRQTNEFNNYMPIQDQQFRIKYDADGNISEMPESLTDGLTVISYTGKEITIKIDIEPKVPFTIKNIGYFDNNNLVNGDFTIVAQDGETKNLVTDINGDAYNYLPKFETDETVTRRYKVSQNKAAYGYATIEDFEIEVKFDANRNIVDTKIVGDVNKYVNFVEVTHKVPSTSADVGYNGNDKGIVNITVKSYPDVKFEIKNVDRQTGTVLAGTSYKMTSSINTESQVATTGTDGIAIANIDKSGYSQTVTYTITELSPSARYQKLTIPVKVEVDFDNLGYVINTPRVVQSSNIATASVPVQVTDEDKFKVNVEIQSNPQLAININKVDEETGKAVPRVDFELTARIKENNLSNYSDEEKKYLTLNTATLTEENYLSQVIDRLKINPEDVELIKQDLGIEKLLQELKDAGNLSADEENEIRNEIVFSAKVNKIAELGKATKTQVNQKVNAITYKEVVDKLISNETTTKDRVDDLLAIVKESVRLDVDNVTTDTDGHATAYMNNTLENKTIEYTLKETKKADGYDWLDEVVIFEVTYDATGKMIDSDPVKLVSGDIDIENINQDGFTFDITVRNKPSDEVRVHLTVEDVYDNDKKLETATFDAFLVDTQYTTSFTEDPKYKIRLETGSDSAHGEDTASFGIYEDGTSKPNRILRFVQKNVPNKYYIGEEKGNATYQSIAYALLVNVQFNDEGKIVSTSVYNPGGDSNSIGFIADGRYIQVSNTRNTINVTIKYYPMLNIKMQAVDMYTEDSLEGNFSVDTRKWGNGAAAQDEYVTSGYINPYWGTYYSYGRTYNIKYVTDNTVESVEKAEAKAISPTEADVFPQNREPDTKERIFYIYENAEPNSPLQYQTYLDRYITNSIQYLMAEIKVTYTDIGEVKSVEVLKEYSRNNITSGFMEVKKSTDNPYEITIKVKYAPITKISATVVDDVSGAPLSGININPYVNRTNTSSTSYEYRTTLYYTTGSGGSTSWTYWGASVANGSTRYTLDTYTTGSGYEGYIDPQNIILDVSYGDNGRISNVELKSTDSYGDANAFDITWDNDNNIKLKIRYCRKFNVKLNKIDYYDSNTRLNANFRVVSSQGVIANLTAGKSGFVGKIYPGKTITYTLSETSVPTGYIPIENLVYTVKFNINGTIAEANSTSEYYENVKFAELDATTSKVGKVDLEANIKNRPRFDVSIDLRDKFYPDLKLQGAKYEITNSKGEIATGNVETDARGVLTTYVGSIYPNETVTYTVKQINTVPGYYENTTVAQFEVEFNANGKIKNYKLLQGNEIVTIDPAKHVGTKAITLNMVNMPKDVKIGIKKYDKLTNEAMDKIEFTVKAEVVGGPTNEITPIVTNEDGTVTAVIDNFKETTSNRVVIYTISEIKAAETYRKIQDVVIKVTYNQDGSMYLYDVISNESGVGVEAATSQKIKYCGTNPVHINLNVPNDNAYDLIVKDEDKDYSGLGIEGTKYDITINGVRLGDSKTDENGQIKYLDRTENGIMEIAVSENTVGEGYRGNLNNKILLEVEKGITEYTLVLNEARITAEGYTLLNKTEDAVTGTITYEIEVDSSTNTIAIVEVNEGKGLINITFKNETKLELTLSNIDINTKDKLEGSVFEVVENELDSSGNVIAGTNKTITTAANNTVDVNGQLYFDLGKAYQSKIIEYTFTQITAPSGYTEILPIKVVVTFDAYGKVISMTDNSFRAQEALATNSGKSRHIVVVIGNGTVDPTYTIKIISEDAVLGRRINGSIFQVEAIEQPSGVTNVSKTGPTTEKTGEFLGSTTVLERGILDIPDVSAENEVDIKFSQTETATGYIYGDNVTSGTVKIKTTFTVNASNLETDLSIDLVDDGGFEVYTSDENRTVTIIVKNDPIVEFDITKVDSNSGEKLEGVNFNITSAIYNAGTLTNTTLNNTTKATNANGYTEATAGYPYESKTIIYTITEPTIDGYKDLEPINVKVTYDAEGNIIDYEVISNLDDVDIKDGTKSIEKRIMNEIKPGVLEIEKQSIVVPTGKGSRILQMTIKNEKNTEPPTDNEFGFKITKVDSELFQVTTGTTEFVLTDKQTGAERTIVTDEFGVAAIEKFDLPTEAGNYKYTLKETKAPTGYTLNPNEMYIYLTFDKDAGTGKIYLKTVNVEGKIVYEQPEEGSLPDRIIRLKAIDEDESYRVVIEKHHELDPDYPNYISNVVFDITVEEEYGETRTWEATTDENGLITSDKFNGYGTITVTIQEKSTPGNYKLKTEKETLVFTRNKETKLLEEIRADVGHELDSENQIAYLKPVNEIASGIYDVVINKVDDTNKLIINNPAKFGLYMLRDYYETKDEVDETTGTTTPVVEVTQIKEPVVEGMTSAKGSLVVDAIPMPTEAGTYKYVLAELSAPAGYSKLKEEAQIEITFAENSIGDLVITDVNVVSGSGVKVLRHEKQFISFAVVNTETEEGQINIDITKVDKDGNAITTDTAIFKVEDLSTNEVQYVETDSLANATKSIAMPTAQGTYEYKVTEVKAPEGYVLDRNSIDITITTQKIDDEIVISDIQVTGDNVKYANKVADGETPSSTIKLEVTNIEGTNGGDANDKPYTVIINKIDSVTRELIKENATFNVSLVNGEIVNAATNGEGKIIIENVFMPSKEGEYEITLKEIIAPNGYYLDPDTKIAKVTFSGTGDSMVISDIQLDDAHNSNIEIVTAECTEDKIVLNVLNEKEDDDLYVISKKDSAGEDIYDVMKEYAGKQYKIDKPFIDTRVAKSGNNIKVQEFMDNLESNGVMTVWDKDGNQIDPASKVKTGYILKSTKGSKELTFEIVVKGDIDGDGRVRSKDLDMLIKHLAGGANTFTADPIKMRAADIVDDGNGRVRSNDLNEFYKVLAK